MNVARTVRVAPARIRHSLHLTRSRSPSSHLSTQEKCERAWLEALEGCAAARTIAKVVVALLAARTLTASDPGEDHHASADSEGLYLLTHGLDSACSRGQSHVSVAPRVGDYGHSAQDDMTVRH
jgi:hypothetical protein